MIFSYGRSKLRNQLNGLIGTLPIQPTTYVRLLRRLRSQGDFNIVQRRVASLNASSTRFNATRVKAYSTAAIAVGSLNYEYQKPVNFSGYPPITTGSRSDAGSYSNIMMPLSNWALLESDIRKKEAMLKSSSKCAELSSLCNRLGVELSDDYYQTLIRYTDIRLLFNKIKIVHELLALLEKHNSVMAHLYFDKIVHTLFVENDAGYAFIDLFKLLEKNNLLSHKNVMLIFSEVVSSDAVFISSLISNLTRIGLLNQQNFDALCSYKRQIQVNSRSTTLNDSDDLRLVSTKLSDLMRIGFGVTQKTFDTLLKDRSRERYTNRQSLPDVILTTEDGFKRKNTPLKWSLAASAFGLTLFTSQLVYKRYKNDGVENNTLSNIGKPKKRAFF